MLQGQENLAQRTSKYQPRARYCSAGSIYLTRNPRADFHCLLSLWGCCSLILWDKRAQNGSLSNFWPHVTATGHCQKVQFGGQLN